MPCFKVASVQRTVVKSRYRYGKVTGAGSKSRLKMKTPIVPTHCNFAYFKPRSYVIKLREM